MSDSKYSKKVCIAMLDQCDKLFKTQEINNESCITLVPIQAKNYDIKVLNIRENSYEKEMVCFPNTTRIYNLKGVNRITLAINLNFETEDSHFLTISLTNENGALLMQNVPLENEEIEIFISANHSSDGCIEITIDKYISKIKNRLVLYSK